MKNHLDDSLSNKKEKLAKLRLKLDTLEQKRTKLVHEWLALKEEVTDAEMPKELTPELILTRNYSVFESKKSYDALQKYMAQFHSVRVEGYYPETGHKALRIGMREKIPFDVQAEEIKRFLPFVSQVKTTRIHEGNDVLEFDAQRIGISEPTCGQHGIFILLIANGAPILCKTTHGWTSVLKRFKSVDEALIHIYEHLANDY